MQNVRFGWWAALLAVSLVVASPASADEPLQARVERKLAEAGLGPRFGLVVTTEDGRELVAVDPDGRFIPASNAKLLITVATFATLPGLDQPDASGGASVRLDGADVILTGHGDARLSSAPDCVLNCLAALADAVAAQTRVVRNLVGDDSLFPDQRWSPGMSWNNMASRSGTATSALSLDNNELVIRVAAGEVGRPPRLELLPYYLVDNRAVTVASGPTDLSFDRPPGSSRGRLTGTIAAGSDPDMLRIAIDDPAHYAAWRFGQLLATRGVRVVGTIQVRHRPAGPVDDPARRGSAPPARPPEPPHLAKLVPLPLAADLRQINKASQNLHAELMLRRLGRLAGTGSIADGLTQVAAVMARAGVPRTGWDLADGSGMSTYNRLSPRAVTGLLRWVSAQPWAVAWRNSLPVAGVDGTLARRFRGTPLEGRLFAKTGSLHATSALSGYLQSASGRTLIFSAFANDTPDGVNGAAIIDAALLLVADAN